MARRTPPKKAFSVRLPAKLARFIERTARRDPRFYNQTHLIEEALLAFEEEYRADPEGIDLADDASLIDDEDDHY
jgi:Arc/MetJ-type ribon-helix-helix transcriptional regulator